MGKNLTAEQIREKIAKIAEESAKKKEETQNQYNSNANTFGAGANTGFGAEKYEGNTDFSANALTKAGISSLTTTNNLTNNIPNYTETENKEETEKNEEKREDLSQSTAQFNTQDSWSSLYTLTSSNTNKVEENGEKYDTKVVNTDEVLKKSDEEQKPCLWE